MHPRRFLICEWNALLCPVCTKLIRRNAQHSGIGLLKCDNHAGAVFRDGRHVGKRCGTDVFALGTGLGVAITVELMPGEVHQFAQGKVELVPAELFRSWGLTAAGGQ